ncbi:MAG: hypothetical protein HY459_02495 [Parcubacteria group bacterium]|nr:hypothetical protein [Parcubacteria group bacterium]
MKTKYIAWVFCFLLSALAAKADECGMTAARLAKTIRADTLAIVMSVTPDNAGLELRTRIYCSDGAIKEKIHDGADIIEQVRNARTWFTTELVARDVPLEEIDHAVDELFRRPEQRKVTMRLNGRDYTHTQDKSVTDYTFSVKKADELVFERRAGIDILSDKKQTIAAMKQAFYVKEKDFNLAEGKSQGDAAKKAFADLAGCQVALKKLEAAGISSSVWQDERDLVENKNYMPLLHPQTLELLQPNTRAVDLEQVEASLLKKSLDYYAKRSSVNIGPESATRFLSAYHLATQIEREFGVTLDQRQFPAHIGLMYLEGAKSHEMIRTMIDLIGDHDADLVNSWMIDSVATKLLGVDYGKIPEFVTKLVERIQFTLASAPRYPGSALFELQEPYYTARFGFDASGLLRIQVEQPPK